MVTNLQFAAVAAYLLWCLFSSLSDVLGSDTDGREGVVRGVRRLPDRDSRENELSG